MFCGRHKGSIVTDLRGTGYRTMIQGRLFEQRHGRRRAAMQQTCKNNIDMAAISYIMLGGFGLSPSRRLPSITIVVHVPLHAMR